MSSYYKGKRSRNLYKPGNPKPFKLSRSKIDRFVECKRCFYLDRRLDKMHYADLLAKDMEIGSGMVEGAIKNLIGKRCDHGGMRWIKERAEAVVQLRCIEANGDWETFMSFVHDRLQAQAQQDGARPRLQMCEPAPLPEIEVAV